MRRQSIPSHQPTSGNQLPAIYWCFACFYLSNNVWGRRLNDILACCLITAFQSSLFTALLEFFVTPALDIWLFRCFVQWPVSQQNFMQKMSTKVFDWIYFRSGYLQDLFHILKGIFVSTQTYAERLCSKRDVTEWKAFLNWILHCLHSPRPIN